MTPLLWFLIAAFMFFLFLAMLVIAGLKAPEANDPIAERLAELGMREEVMTLEEIELSQRFFDRIVLPAFNRVGSFASKFTPKATLQSARHRLDMAGNPMQMDPAFFLGLRFILAVVFGVLIITMYLLGGRNMAQGLGFAALFTIIGFFFPDLWLSGRIKSRQKTVFRSMPDALDLLTICVEAGLGFDAALSRVHKKWENDLSLEFGRVIQEIRLGKLRRDALRAMSERLGVPEMTSFVAAVIQSDQLGVSMAKVLRIQSNQMRVRRRQMAEEEAHRAPIKMVFPIALLIFPSIMIILLGPAAMLLINSPMAALF
ncbi:MAG: type II secretion system F family protein [Chloroflexi bacterium]|nr:type II secretion system F family protein [Chloroflexota bacterium]